MLDKLKLLLGIDATDTDLDEKLNLILSNTAARMKILLGGIEPPEELAHVVLDVAVIRFNRIGSEGLTSHSVEGESMNFASGDFDGYMSEIQAYLDANEESKRGKVCFL